MSWENWVLTPARAFQKQVPFITQGTCTAHSTNTPRPRQLQMAALLNGQHVRAHTISENSLQFGSAHWNVQAIRTLGTCRSCKPTLICAQLDS